MKKYRWLVILMILSIVGGIMFGCKKYNHTEQKASLYIDDVLVAEGVTMYFGVDRTYPKYSFEYALLPFTLTLERLGIDVERFTSDYYLFAIGEVDYLADRKACSAFEKGSSVDLLRMIEGGTVVTYVSDDEFYVDDSSFKEFLDYAGIKVSIEIIKDSAVKIYTKK